MSPQSVSVLIVSDQESVRKEVSESLLKSEISTLKSVPFAEGADQVKSLSPSLIFVDINGAAVQTVSSFIEKALACVPAEKIIGVGEPSDISLFLKLVQVGVKDFVNLPFDASRFQTEKPSSTISIAEAPAVQGKSGKLLTVYSPKGGTGVTLVTVNLAVSLAARKKNDVVVLDLSPNCGDVATYLNLSPHHTIRDVVDRQGDFDLSFIEGSMLLHESGVKILAAPRPDQTPLSADLIHPVKILLALLKKHYSTVLIDAGALNPALLQLVLSESDGIYLVGNPDVVSLKGLIAFVNHLKNAHYAPEKIKVLVNRYNSKYQVGVKEFEKLTHHTISTYLPNDYSLCIEAANAGKPLPEKSELARKIAELVEGPAAKPTPRLRMSWFAPAAKS